MAYIYLSVRKAQRLLWLMKTKFAFDSKNFVSMPMFVRDAWIESWSWLCVVLHADYWNQLPVNGSDLRPKNLDFSMVLNCVWNVPTCQCPSEVPLAIGSAYIQRKCPWPTEVPVANGSACCHRNCLLPTEVPVANGSACGWRKFPWPMEVHVTYGSAIFDIGTK